jgi:hypothetical protein
MLSRNSEGREEGLRRNKEEGRRYRRGSLKEERRD